MAKRTTSTEPDEGPATVKMSVSFNVRADRAEEIESQVRQLLHPLLSFDSEIKVS